MLKRMDGIKLGKKKVSTVFLNKSNLFLLKSQTQIMSLLHSIDQLKVFQEDYLMLIN